MIDDIHKNFTLKLILPFCIAILAIFFLVQSIQQIPIKEIYRINDRHEGCLSCHLPMDGFAQSHNPLALGCSSCHLGDPFTLIKDEAHKDIILIPGNINNANITCGRSECHPVIANNIQNTLMTTGRGIVTVDHYVFGESDSPDGHGNLSDLGDSPADKHLRNLCSSCHLAQNKKSPAPNTQLSRGGGCLACHLNYDTAAQTELIKYKSINELPTNHPSLTINISNDQCFGCHSRSGRISTNYEGWHETLMDTISESNKINYQQLDDGRIFSKQQADIHFEKEMDCIDCHTWREAMGTGKSFNHKEEQIEIGCEDCHSNKKNTTNEREFTDDIDKKILRLRGWDNQSQNYVVTNKTKKPLLNTLVDKDNNTHLKLKNNEKILPLTPALPICNSRIKGHNRLSCKSCHSAWAPHCLGCHTKYTTDEEIYDHNKHDYFRGGWVEYSGEFLVDVPTLGIRVENGEEIIDTFIPGMIMTISKSDNDRTFKRLYAPVAPHTTSANARNCKSCHNNPVAIGFGRGQLKFEKNYGHWVFIPIYKINPIDNLPEDAWIGFLKNRTGMVSTRIGARPFNVEEQKKILNVGACLTCHDENSKNLKEIFFNFNEALKRISKQCVIMID